MPKVFGFLKRLNSKKVPTPQLPKPLLVQSGKRKRLHPSQISRTRRNREAWKLILQLREMNLRKRGKRLQAAKKATVNSSLLHEYLVNRREATQESIRQQRLVSARNGK